jgi:phosphoribosylformylglycinamidine synthase PurS subunit
MVLVCSGIYYQLPHGFQTADAGDEIQRRIDQKITAFPGTGGYFTGFSLKFPLALGSHHFYCLRNSIFVIQTTRIMTYNVQIKVMPLRDLLDPQGKAVLGGLQNLGLGAVSDVRVGKHITLQVDADSETKAKEIAEEATKKLLANPVMEFFEIEMIN